MWPIVGHNRAVAYLKRSLDSNVLSHAYLFAGPKNVGKMTLALVLAQAVNCSASEKPCGECPSCLKIAARNHPDVQVIKPLAAEEAEDKKAKSEIIIDQVRTIQHWASLPPYEGRYRVFIFEQAELLNEAAANCLLKVLEEPLPNVLFILLAPSTGAVPETVASRCQNLSLKPVSAEEIENLLLSRGLAPDQAGVLARLADGAPGWALTALEQNDILTSRAERVEKFLGLVNQDYEGRFEAAEELAGKGAQGRSDAAGIIRDLKVLWRDLLMVKIGHVDGIINLDYRDKIMALGNRLSHVDIRAFITVLTAAEEWVGCNVNPRLILEMLMLDMPLVDKVRAKR